MTLNLLNGDSVQLLETVESESVDLVVTSPPYDDLRLYGATSSDWNFTTFTKIATQIVRVLKPGAVCVWNVNDKIVNGSKTLTSFKQALYFRELGLNVNDTMIWNKLNPMPQVKQPRYAQSFEYMFVFSKGRPKTFNPIMRPCKNAGQTVTGTAKVIRGEGARVEKTLTINTETIESNVWSFAVSSQSHGHPAVFPEELPRRHILTWTNKGDTVLDPFMGSGTTGVVAKKLERHFTGIELNTDYYKIAQERIKSTRPEVDLTDFFN